MKNIVAFDFDGTLLDSRSRHIAVMGDILNEFKINLDVRNLIEFKRFGNSNIDYLISNGIDNDTAKNIQKKWIENIEKTEYLEQDFLYDDAIDLLDKYSTDNDLILITGRANTDGVNKQIDKFDLRKYFKEIFVVQPGKNLAAEKAKILKSHKAILMIGDTNSDANAAKIADTEFLFYENGFHNKQTAIKG